MGLRYLSSTRGFTLVEVLVAMMVLGIGIMALIGLQASSIKARVNSQQISYAKDLVASKLDQLAAERAKTGGTESHSFRGVNYTISWTSVEYEGQSDLVVYGEKSSLREITVTAKWNDKSTSRELSMKRFVRVDDV